MMGWKGIDSIARALGVITLVALGSGLYGAFFIAPPDAVQGQVQRIMYIHVPTAWVAYLSFFIVFLSSAGYLWKKKVGWDHLAHSSAEIGVVFTGLTILAGSIWGKPAWGAWWTWDARLTTTALLLIIFLAYLMLRSFATDRSQGPRYAAVLGIIGFLDIPIIHMSVVWWRTLHQPPSVMRPGGPTMARSMLFVLVLNLVAFTLLYAYMLIKRVSLEQLRLKSAIVRHG